MTKQEFIEAIAKAAIKYAPKYGIAVVSPVMALNSFPLIWA